MNQSDMVHKQFADILAAATTEAEVFNALHRLSDTLMPVRLWTVMTVDLDAGIARRAYSNMPKAYPPSGTKPITPNAWFDIIHGRRETFVANTLAEIAEVFPDYELIGSLGCGSVMNLPVFDGDSLLGTVNLLDAKGHFTAERVRAVQTTLADPSLAAMRAARAL
ncbi:GAF domain-containing protein [Rhodobacteraceae bacterium N5(2021)]|uniref:GAF domain-containing protein n=1 Tax=Gymnodinialimonas phycosphaerae TaxID=2841589 RepID=A0A975TSG9_9RHOB|nr:GAF domain-containing protein [Gymnodinialimonas phycosphaerae]MBY4893616.1 GAF domain-containing protein [Gymnodinialimonas phycosphaerae]